MREDRLLRSIAPAAMNLRSGATRGHRAPGTKHSVQQRLGPRPAAPTIYGPRPGGRR